MKKILFAVGTRPNFVKLAPLLRHHRGRLRGAGVKVTVVHTGQHYDSEMSAGFLRDLGIGGAHLNLEAGGGSPCALTARVLERFAQACLRLKPDLTVVFGDVDSTLACALAAKKLGLKLCHVEAGLRSGDRSMPEEVNRIAVDALSDLLFTTSRSAARRLLKEGARAAAVKFAGNLMVDSLLHHFRGAGLERRAGTFALLTLHRPANVDGRAGLERALAAAARVARKIEVRFPCHPRTRASIRKYRLSGYFDSNFRLLPPLGYGAMMEAYAGARLVLTDSGCVQDETTALGIPCLTMRENTERPETVSQGTNTLVGLDEGKIMRCVGEVLAGRYRKGRVPELWDGRAAERVWAGLLAALRGR